MPESQHIEWKETWRDEYIRQLCGFANADGGTLVVGRDNRGRPVGVSNARKLLEDLPNKIRDILGVMADVRLVTDSGRDLVEVHVDAYPSPISYKGEYHYRSGSTKQELKGAALTRFLLRKHGKTWDDVPVPGLTTRDLSADAIARFRKLATQSRRMAPVRPGERTPALLDKLNLIEGSRLKRAAALLFHPEPDRFFYGAFVKIGFFRTPSDLLYHDEIRGDLFSQAAKTLDLLTTKYLRAGISYQGIHRVEGLPVPEAALREALLNAIVHRDYSVAAPIQIRVYNNRLRIWNPGHLPEKWSVKKLMGAHSSRPYNPVIANVFFRAGEIEAWGRGIRRIFDECAENSVPVPKLACGPSEFTLEFSFSGQAVGHRIEQVTEQDTEQDIEQVSDPIMRMLHSIAENELPLARIMQGMRLRHRPSFLSGYLHPALKSGAIEMTVPDKPNSRLQKYRLTARGKARLEKASAHSQTPEQVIEQETDQVSDSVLRLLHAIAGEELPLIRIMQILHLRHRPSFLLGYLHPALKSGVIEMTVPDKPNSRLQKYRLTIRGNARLGKPPSHT